jgi:hypothetical protein
MARWFTKEDIKHMPLTMVILGLCNKNDSDDDRKKEIYKRTPHLIENREGKHDEAVILSTNNELLQLFLYGSNFVFLWSRIHVSIVLSPTKGIAFIKLYV